MRVQEFILSEKRRRRKKSRRFYGAGWFGYPAIDSSDSGGGDGGGVAETQEDIENNLPSIDLARNNIAKILQTAQRIYDDWDEADRDTYAGGGICHLIADAICDVMGEIGIDCAPVSCSYEQHVYVAVRVAEGVYTIDIPYSIYETGGGFSWQKLPDVQFDSRDVVFYRVSGDPDEFENYTSLEEAFDPASGATSQQSFKQGVAEGSLNEFAPSPDYRDDDDRQDMPLLEFAKRIKVFLGPEYTMVDHKTPEQVSVKFYPKVKTKFDPKDETSGRNGAILYSLIGKQNEYPTVNFILIDFEQGPEVGRKRRAGIAIPKTRINALKIADIIYNTKGLPAQDRKISENFADGRNPGRRGLAKRMGVPTKASVSKLRQIAKSSSGEKQRMAHWMANMKAGKKK